jgi:hypothetical protein
MIEIGSRDYLRLSRELRSIVARALLAKRGRG